MAAQMHTFGHWRQPWKVTKVLCSDGVRRTAWITGEHDTSFSLPARVKVKGKTVSGFVSGDPYWHLGGVSGDGVDWQFHTYLTGKNAALLP